MLAPTFPRAGPPWTSGVALPGGDFIPGTRDQLANDLATAFPYLGKVTCTRLATAYGTMARQILAGTNRVEDLGVYFGADLYEREVVHLLEREWAMTADDILWRRTKLGLRMSAVEQSRLADWLSARSSCTALPSVV